MHRIQQSFLTHPAFQRYQRSEHGGDLREGQRKLERPLDPKRPLHLVLRSERARGAWSMLHTRNARRVKHEAHRLARLKGVRIYQYANSGNHLHLLVKAPTRAAFQAFLRALSGILARIITGARKGKAIGKFWNKLAYTRIVNWGKDFARTQHYVLINELELLGVFFRSDKSDPKFVRRP